LHILQLWLQIKQVAAIIRAYRATTLLKIVLSNTIYTSGIVLPDYHFPDKKHILAVYLLEHSDLCCIQ